MSKQKPFVAWRVGRIFVAAFFICCVSPWTGNASAQSTLYAEDFNTDGNGTRYTLVRDYYETDNQMWSTVPNTLPGDNVITYLDPGDLYFDGTTVPAKRATFFADNDLGDASFGIDLSAEGFALFDAAIQWASGTDGTTPLDINFVIDDDSFEETNNLDVTLVVLGLVGITALTRRRQVILRR